MSLAALISAVARNLKPLHLRLMEVGLEGVKPLMATAHSMASTAGHRSQPPQSRGTHPALPACSASRECGPPQTHDSS